MTDELTERRPMSSEIKIREATQKDVEAVYMLACELAAAVRDSRPDYEAVQKRLGELLEEFRSWTLVAEGEDGIVGVMSFWIKPDLAHGDVVLEIPMLVVSEDSRREGVGKLLVEEVRKQAHEQSATTIELIATSDNTTAREFYRSLGFVETDHVALEFMGDLNDPPESDEK
jgi:ribosomal protein S18 acetylase RimI-like enzyme